MLAATPPPVIIQKKRGLGCVGCGCAVLALLVVLAAALIGGGSYYLYHALYGCTDASPTTVAQFDGGDQILAATEHDLEDFKHALELGQPGSLRLNSDQINTLIARDPSFAQLRGHLFVTLRGSEATLQTSLPLSSFETVLFPDRYLNGDATFALGFTPEDKSVNLDLHALHLKGNDLPASFDDSFNQSFNRVLNQKLQSNAAVHEFLNRTQKLSVENSQLVIETQ